MEQRARSIRPFVGSTDYTVSRNFYKALGFEEGILSHNMSVFSFEHVSFYLQDANVKDWIDNTMIFLEVVDVDAFRTSIAALDLPGKFHGVRVSDVKSLDWGKEFFLHDPSGVLWHIGQFHQ